MLTLARLQAVEQDRLVLASGTEVPSAWSLVVPPTRGQDVVAETPGLADARGLVPVGETFRSTTYDDVHVVGAAAAVDLPWTTAQPGASPLGSGFPVETQARTATADVAAMLRRRVFRLTPAE
ncbi:hypothetical protein [Nocardioides marmoribigeumensis]|uniref:NADH dehydrogenase FAD-containing subunit n=1 Tax=Nocardioides marmoribigeumensis TaxID=433649 RepID=A0ABU2BTC1_9ACTN|nr:hypothetical protein [Nocardioides marmoribigeumensis]MDR7361877.1 NADH dehydrogenase FAD-containing subunit [Nocardioides marmoribigeumensis]